MNGESKAKRHGVSAATFRNSWISSRSRTPSPLVSSTLNLRTRGDRTALCTGGESASLVRGLVPHRRRVLASNFSHCFSVVSCCPPKAIDIEGRLASNRLRLYAMNSSMVIVPLPSASISFSSAEKLLGSAVPPRSLTQSGLRVLCRNSCRQAEQADEHQPQHEWSDPSADR